MDAPHLQTVLGKLTPQNIGIIDGHTHVWIDDIGSITSAPMILNNQVAIERELSDFYDAGGRVMLDCQPSGCGRNGNRLHQISLATGVVIIACTGFHLRKYYPIAAAIFEMDTEAAYHHFVSELHEGLIEAPQVKAGFIKIACESSLEQSAQYLIKAAVQASLATGAAIEVHTERGLDAQNIMHFILDLGLAPEKLILCHMDKRADFALHRTIAEKGVLLEYDTFLRPKYHPQENGWRLLFQMIDAGFSDQIVLATDLADAQMWQYLGGGVGTVALIKVIKAGLETANIANEIIAQLLGANIARTLAY